MKKIIFLLFMYMNLFASYNTYVKHEKKCIDGQEFILTSVIEERTYNNYTISATLVQVFEFNKLECKTIPKKCK